MTPRQFVHDEMEHICEMTKSLTEEEYCDYLEQLILELTDEREKCLWVVDESHER